MNTKYIVPLQCHDGAHAGTQFTPPKPKAVCSFHLPENVLLSATADLFTLGIAAIQGSSATPERALFPQWDCKNYSK